MDHQVALVVARENGGYVTKNNLHNGKGWSLPRVERAFKELVQSGMVWIDLQGEDSSDLGSEIDIGGPSNGNGNGNGNGGDANANAKQRQRQPLYWFPSLFDSSGTANGMETEPLNVPLPKATATGGSSR